MLRARAYLRSHPRATLFLVLSFTLGVLRPALTSIAHQHAGGEHAHLHLDVVAAAPIATVAVERAPARAPGQRGLATAPVHDLHTHLFASFVLAQLPDLPAVAAALDRVAAVAPRPATQASAGVVRVGQARAPPTLQA